MSFAVRRLGMDVGNPITIPSNWGGFSGASPQTSTTKTLTVPAGSTGDVRLRINTLPAGTLAYSKNAAAFVGIAVDTTVNFANTDTLAFKLTGAADDAGVTALDLVYNTVIGNCTLHTT